MLQILVFLMPWSQALATDANIDQFLACIDVCVAQVDQPNFNLKSCVDECKKKYLSGWHGFQE